MNALARAFKRVASQVARRNQFPFGEFLDEHGLQGLLADATASNYDLVELTSQALWQLCVSDGRFNNFMVGLQTVLQFLNEQRGDAGLDRTQAFRDLVTILRQGGPLPAIRVWVTTHYG